MKPRSLLIAAFVFAATLALAIRLLRFAYRDSADMLFMDQWDFLNPLFDGKGLFAMFVRQHGPHREGVGGVLIGILYPLTHWSGRADAVAAASAPVIAAVLALFWVRKFGGGLSPFDVVLPLFLISPTSFELFSGPTNLAHGPVPVVLAFLAALVVGMRASQFRPLWLGLIGGLAIFTGFAIFLAPPLFAILLFEAVRAFHAKESKIGLAAAGGLALILLFAAAFTIDYQHTNTGLLCYPPTDRRSILYVPFAGMQLMRPYGSYARHLDRPLKVVASILLLFAVGLCLYALRKMSKKERSPVGETIFLLASYSTLFAIDSALGRTCFGLWSAGSSRYVLYAVPLGCAFYFWIRTTPMPRALSTALLVSMLALGALSNEEQLSNYGQSKWLHDWRQDWEDCYLAHHDLARCDKEHTPLHPNPAATEMQRKLDYLEAHHLNLFR